MINESERVSASSRSSLISKKEDKRDFWIDWMRSICVFFVIIVHSIWNAMVAIDI